LRELSELLNNLILFRTLVRRGAAVSIDGHNLRTPKLLIPDEVATMFRVSAITIINLANECLDSGGTEGIPGIKIGKQWRFNEQVIVDILNGKLLSKSGGSQNNAVEEPLAPPSRIAHRS
jgi:hypothetical protein